MKTLLIVLSLVAAGLLHAADAETWFFARETAKDSTRIALTVEGTKVYGTKHWQPKGEEHGASGYIDGTLEDGKVRGVFVFTIEGSEVAEQVMYQLKDGQLLEGEGELVDRKNDGKLTFKNADAVTFRKALQCVPVSEPKAGTPERKAMMDAMRGPVASHVGKAVIFTGNLRVAGDWARFQGNVAPADGKRPKSDAGDDLELDFFALLKKDAKGAWQVMHWGFAGDISVRDGAREKFTKAPWVLFE